MKKPIVLDTDIVIHLLKKQTECVERFIELFEKEHTFLYRPLSLPKSMQGLLSENTNK